MNVIKRDGEKHCMVFDEITSRLKLLSYGLDEMLDAAEITLKVLRRMYSGVKTMELDNMAAEIAANMALIHPDYGILATRIAVSNLHKETKEKFSDVISDLYYWMNPETQKMSPLISDDIYHTVLNNSDKLNSAVTYDRDYNFTYFGFKTLEKSYLLKINNKVVERPQHMFLRISLGIHKDDIQAAIETYHLMSEKWFIHSPETLINSGKIKPMLHSCFLASGVSDQIEDVYTMLRNCAVISKNSRSVGLSVHNVKVAESHVDESNENSGGLLPLLRVYDSTASYINQNKNKRPGAFAIYLEPWHADVFEFLDLKKNSGKEEQRARDLFYALWIPDLFMHRVEENGDWTLMCPNECPGLADVWDEEFDQLYTKYESEGKGKKTVKAQKLWYAIIESQIATGTPYMLYKDNCNRKSNQQNLGTIKCSSFGAEIIQYSSPDEIAACCTASLALNMFVRPDRTFDFQQLQHVTKVAIHNLNRIVDASMYTVQQAKLSSKLHRPIGLGVQGLADAFILMRFPFDGPQAKQLNKEIFETIYFAALDASCELAERDGPYETYQGSPVSKGILQHDIWNVKPVTILNWDGLRQRIAKHGVRNSLLLAVAPSQSITQILGINESTNIYSSLICKFFYSETFMEINKHLLKDLKERGLWTDDVKNQIIAAGGSIQSIPSIPDDLKNLYKTSLEIKHRVLLEMAADRAAFIDQSQALTIHMQEPNFIKLSGIHFFCWKSGLKTGIRHLKINSQVSMTQYI